MTQDQFLSSPISQTDTDISTESTKVIPLSTSSPTLLTLVECLTQGLLTQLNSFQTLTQTLSSQMTSVLTQQNQLLDRILTLQLNTPRQFALQGEPSPLSDTGEYLSTEDNEEADGEEEVFIEWDLGGMPVGEQLLNELAESQFDDAEP